MQNGSTWLLVIPLMATKTKHYTAKEEIFIDSCADHSVGMSSLAAASTPRSPVQTQYIAVL